MRTIGNLLILIGKALGGVVDVVEKSGVERPSPQDWVPEGRLIIIKQPVGVLVNLVNSPFIKPPKVWIPPIPDTNSMDGVFDYGNNNILVSGADASEQGKLVDFLKVGDIVVYRIMADLNDSLDDFHKPHKAYAIHRIIEIGADKVGRYFTLKGDNNAVKDPYRVYPHNILWVSIGVIY